MTEPSLETRRATDADAEAISIVLAAAFAEDPGTIVIEPDRVRRSRFTRPFFRAFVLASLADGADVVVPAEAVTGVAIWFGPGRYGPSDEAMAAHGLGHALEVLGPAGTDRLVAMIGELEAQHASRMGARPHLRLDFFGVAPEVQGRGIGRVLADVGHRRADALELPCCLETFTMSNVRFYEHRGYELVGQYTVGHGVPVYFLERSPQPR